ncbi:tapasin-related protein-like isoform X8 [Dermochelys coriacea]|uniref:tapasin-related protein-like isoform X8 n=1 Tax=Dermochelys coriacea TaxID=27794 RepID=UPI001CA9BE37|nr:tapasin-related protein-like isoform X8 [Dermochelys coriacea]
MINRSLISGVQPQLGHASRLLRSRLLLPPITLPPRLSWGPGAASLSLTPCGADTDSASVAMSRSPLTLLVILSLLGGCASKLAVETDASPMRAKVGDNVVLKCQFSVARPPVDLSQLVVQWFHRGGQLVEFDNVVSGSRPGANLSMEGLRSGNAALYLSKVTLESAGNYRCYITYMHDMRIKQTPRRRPRRSRRPWPLMPVPPTPTPWW